MQFSPCRGKDNCTEGGTHCDGCGRTHEEIASTRALIASIADYAIKMGYENYSEFTSFLGDKSEKVIRFRLENQ